MAPCSLPTDRQGIEKVELIAVSPVWDETRCETCTVPVGEDSYRGHKTEKAKWFAFSRTCAGRGDVFAGAKTTRRVRSEYVELRKTF